MGSEIITGKEILLGVVKGLILTVLSLPGKRSNKETT
jgi:hypothetical protein